MTTQYKTRAFVFRKSDRNEADRSFSVFTDNFGRLDVFAKSIRKITSKLRPDIDIFYFSEIEFVQGKSHKTLIDAAKIKRFDGISKDLTRLNIIHKISGLLDSFIKGQEKDDETFDLLIDFLDKLEYGSDKIKNYQLAYQYFFWNFISLQGYKLEVNSCVICRSKLNPYSIYFSNKDGGTLCKGCLKSDKEVRKINSDVAKTLRLILKKDWETVSKLKIGAYSQGILEDISENAIHSFCPM